jgi:hypothetical protein
MKRLLAAVAFLMPGLALAQSPPSIQPHIYLTQRRIYLLRQLSDTIRQIEPHGAHSLRIDSGQLIVASANVADRHWMRVSNLLVSRQGSATTPPTLISSTDSPDSKFFAWWDASMLLPYKQPTLPAKHSRKRLP